MTKAKQKNIVYLALLIAVFSACENDIIEPSVSRRTIHKEVVLEEKGRFDNKPFEWDYTFMPFLSPNVIFIGTLSFPADTVPPSILRSKEKAGLKVQNSTGIYVGAVYPFSSIESGLFDKEIVSLEKNPIRMLFKFPMDYRFQMVDTKDKQEYLGGLGQALDSDKYRDHVSSLNEGARLEVGYSITEYSALSDVEKAFGANPELGSVFASKIQSNSKTVNVNGRMLAYLVGKNFKVSMVTPTNGFFVNEEDNKRDNLAYLRALSYGKLAFVSIESSYSYEEVKKAFEVGVKYKFIDAGANYDQKTKDVFAGSRITIMAIGDNTKETFYMNSTENLKEIFHTSYTKLAYGKPIFVEMNKVVDGGAFIPEVNSDEGRGRS